MKANLAFNNDNYLRALAKAVVSGQYSLPEAISSLRWYRLPKSSVARLQRFVRKLTKEAVTTY